MTKLLPHLEVAYSELESASKEQEADRLQLEHDLIPKQKGVINGINLSRSTVHGTYTNKYQKAIDHKLFEKVWEASLKQYEGDVNLALGKMMLGCISDIFNDLKRLTDQESIQLFQQMGKAEAIKSFEFKLKAKMNQLTSLSEKSSSSDVLAILKEKNIIPSVKQREEIRSALEEGENVDSVLANIESQINNEEETGSSVEEGQ